MTVSKTPRPWYCLSPLVDDYRAVHDTGGDLSMLKLVKAFQVVLFNVGVITLTLTAYLQGIESVFFYGGALVIMAAYNGVTGADVLALLQAIREVNEEAQAGEDS